MITNGIRVPLGPWKTKMVVQLQGISKIIMNLEDYGEYSNYWEYPESLGMFGTIRGILTVLTMGWIGLRV